MDARLRTDEDLRAAAGEARLTVAYSVDDAPTRAAGWWVRLDPDAPAAGLGAPDRADGSVHVEIRTDRKTALALATGALTLQRAHAESLAEVSGDVSEYLRHSAAFACLDGVLREVTEC